MVSELDVRMICLGFPETEEKPWDGLPGFRVRDKLFARLREAPEALVIYTRSVAIKEALIESEPDKFFQTPHYANYPNVLVRLEAIARTELFELLLESWLIRAPKTVGKAFLIQLENSSL